MISWILKLRAWFFILSVDILHISFYEIDSLIHVMYEEAE